MKIKLKNLGNRIGLTIMGNSALQRRRRNRAVFDTFKRGGVWPGRKGYVWVKQGTLTEGVDSVQLTSSFINSLK
jgi:hypothetical protein